jgi:hypothetical protein
MISYKIDEDFSIYHYNQYTYELSFQLTKVKENLEIQHHNLLVQTEDNQDLIKQVLGKNTDIERLKLEGIEIIIFYKTLKEYNEISIGRKKYKYLICQTDHLYNGTSYDKLFKLSEYKECKVKDKVVKKYNSLNPFKYRFQTNQFAGMVLVDIKRNLIFYHITENFEVNKPTGKFETNFLKYLQKGIRYQLFKENSIPHNITGFNISNKKILVINFQFTALHLVDNLIQNNNKVFVCSSNYIPKNMDLTMMLYSSFKLFYKNNLLIDYKKEKILSNKNLLIFDTQNNHDYITKSIIVLNLMKNNNIDVDSLIRKHNINDLRELVDNFSITLNN